MSRRSIDLLIDCGGILLMGGIIILASTLCRGDEPLPVPIPDPISVQDEIILPTTERDVVPPTPSPDPQPAPDVEPVVIDSLAIGELYVVRFTGKPWRVIDSRRGIVAIEQQAGPRDFYARRADGDRATETAWTVEEPHMHIVKGLTAGQVELICVPPDDRPEVRVMLTVTGAQPPPDPEPVLTDVLAGCHKADRKSQVEILRGLAAKNLARDAAGLQAAKDFVNAERIRRRTEDWIPYTDAVAEAIVSGQVGVLADKLEGKP